MQLIGERKPIDLTRVHFQRQKGQIMVYGTWYLGGYGTIPRPCLVLANVLAMPPAAMLGCVLLDDAHLWSEEVGDPQYAAVTSFNMARRMGLNVADIGEPMKVATAIRDHLSDLISIPPMPPSERVVVADATMVDESGRTIVSEILDYE